jgi:hypothetical protein
MPLQERAGLSEQIEHLVVRHGRSVYNTGRKKICQPAPLPSTGTMNRFPSRPYVSVRVVARPPGIRLAASGARDVPAGSAASVNHHDIAVVYKEHAAVRLVPAAIGGLTCAPP